MHHVSNFLVNLFAVQIYFVCRRQPAFAVVQETEKYVTDHKCLSARTVPRSLSRVGSQLSRTHFFKHIMSLNTYTTSTMYVSRTCQSSLVSYVPTLC